MRKAGETASQKSQHVSLKDLFDDVVTQLASTGHSTTVVSVKRGTQKEDYSEPVDNKNRHDNVVSAEGQTVH